MSDFEWMHWVFFMVIVLAIEAFILTGKLF
jgi:hypothetical protein